MAEKNVLRPKVVYRKVQSRTGYTLGIFSGLIILIGILEAMFFLKLNLFESVILAAAMLFFYVVLLIFLLQPKVVRVIKHPPRRNTYENQIAKEIERPIVINVNDKKETKTVTTKTAPVQKYEYTGSTAAKTFHKSSCRLAKLIKPKYRLSHNQKTYFSKQRYTPCKICINGNTKKKTTKKTKKKRG